MNPIVGWGLALLLLVIAWQSYGWQGVIFAITVIVFWLLLQFNRVMRVMKNAGSAPVGHVDSAVMLNAKLTTGMTMMQIVTLTRSLGERVSKEPEVWRWTDPGGSSVTLTMNGAKLAQWTLARPPAEAP